MKRFALLLFLFVPLLSGADERILSFHSHIVIGQDGWLDVTETITVRAEGKRIRRGIYRDFPTHYVDARGRDVIVEFEVLTVHRDDSPEPYHIRKQSNGQRLYIGSEHVFLDPGFYEYRIEYRTSRQLGYFEQKLSVWK